ncbi:MAG TPA: sigma-54 dependent transcriptional regulator [Planctomycetota bacterium]|nr:sigma-54 dependent transcriptional regulator [Planctomycetota bacterium]
MRTPPRILVIEDDTDVREQLLATFRDEGYEVTACGTVREGKALLKSTGFALVTTDLRLPDASGLEVVRHIQASCPDCPVLVLTAFASVDSAVEAMRHGAFHYLAKPFSVNGLLVEVERALEHARLLRERSQLRERLSAESGLGRILGGSPAIESVRGLIREVARTSTTVLITGETGTGKELVANALHYESPRATGPLVKLNCAALTETLLESELFGHEKGAFTGAERSRAGRFERADGGTLFLDEISEMGPHVQAKLLRVLQGEAFERVGGDQPLRPDVRLVAATNRDPQQAVAEGKLRQDLFFRLNIVCVEVPPLRKRPEDIPLLARHFLGIFADRFGRGQASLDDEALNALCAYPWPGNVRELENCIERAVIVAQDGTVRRRNLPAPISGIEAEPPGAPLNLEALEKRAILQALRETGGNKSQAAAKLGIFPSSLYKKMKRFDIPLQPEP